MKTTASHKRRAILEAAKEAFIAYGYSGASIETIAETAPVSKPTLYNHFKNKQDLFAAVIHSLCTSLLHTLNNVQTEINDPIAGLKAIANAFVDLVYAEEAIQLYRLIIAEQQQFPELGELIYHSGPEPVLEQMCCYLAELNSQGILAIPTIESSSRLFLSMLKGDEYLRCLLGLQSGLNEQAKQELIEAAVSLFVKAHGYPMNT